MVVSVDSPERPLTTFASRPRRVCEQPFLNLPESVARQRVDEPHLINGSVEQMRAMLWPMLDNKFLKHPGLGFKLLLRPR